jgi:uncharacterized protein (DUF433 family)
MKREIKTPKIVCRRDTMMGKPIVEGTRITVDLLLEKLGAGETPAQILDGFLNLTAEGLQAAVDFARETITLWDEDDVLPEYHLDYSKSKPNHYAGRVRHSVTVRLNTDVAEVFSTDETVNRALRAILQALPDELKTAA